MRATRKRLAGLDAGAADRAAGQADALPPGQIVAVYRAIGSELDVEALSLALIEAGRELCLPVVVERDAPMIFRRWSPGEPLELDEASWIAPLRQSFLETHERRFGHRPPDGALVLERMVLTLQTQGTPGARGPVEASGGGETPGGPEGQGRLCLPDPATPSGHTVEPLWMSVPLWRRSRLAPGQELAGPALVLEDTGTLVLEPV